MSERSRPIEPTGIATCDTAGRVGGVRVLGVLHEQPLAIARLTGAITRYERDVVAVEASAEAIEQSHPDVRDARWPPRDDREAAAFATDPYDLLLAGIDTQDDGTTVDFERLDRRNFILEARVERSFLIQVSGIDASAYILRGARARR